MYRFLADVTVAVHVAYVLCVILGLLLILLGKALGWEWIRNRWFRCIHLGMIATVVLRAIIWTECPLTTWELELRELAGQVNFEGSSLGWALHALIHPNLPVWVFPIIYVAFGLLILSTFWLAPVRWRPEDHKEPARQRSLMSRA